MIISKRDFISALAFVVHAAGKKDVRYYLNAVHLEMVSNTLHVVATDGHRMAAVELSVPGTVEDFSVTLSRESVVDLLKIVKTKPSDVSVTDIAIGDEVKIANIPMTKAEGTYPAWRRVMDIADDGMVNTGISSEYVAQSMTACKVLTTKGSKYGVDLKIQSAQSILITPTVASHFSTIVKARIRVMGFR